MLFTKAMELLAFCIKENKAAMLHGSPGSGKSDGVRALYASVSIPLTVITPSTMETVDYRGLPKHSADGSRVVWSMPDFVAKLWDDYREHGSCGLFIDEANSVGQSMQVPLMQLTLERRIGPHDLPPGCRITLAGNYVKDRAAAQRMGTALANRLWHIDVAIDVDAWLAWAASRNIAPEIVAFVKWRGETVLNSSTGEADERARPTPRSVADCSEAVQLPDALRMSAIAARVGEAWATEFEGFLQVYRNAPPIAEILRNPNSVPVVHGSSLQYATAICLSNASTPDTFGNALTYAARMSDEIASTLWSDAKARKPELVNTAAYINFAAAHSHLMV